MSLCDMATNWINYEHWKCQSKMIKVTNQNLTIKVKKKIKSKLKKIIQMKTAAMVHND